MIIGVTGGVGTGKSTILNILKESYNAEIIIADDVARDSMMPGHEPYEKIAEYFGDDILTDGPGSCIDRGALADLVFNDRDKLAVLNGYVHPAVKKEIIAMTDGFKAEGRSLIVIETAILIEAGYLDLVDELWVIYTDLETRVKRLMDSRGYSREKTESIINNQMPFDELKQYADFIIDNSFDIDLTSEQIREHMKKCRR